MPSPHDSHVFQRDITNFELRRALITTNILTKFLEDWTLNVTLRVLTKFIIAIHRKMTRPLAVIFVNGPEPF